MRMDAETADFWAVIFQGIQLAITLAAACIGGWWFFFQRKTKPWAEIELSLNSISLPERRRFIRVTAIVTNKGNVRLDPPSATVEVREVLPFDDNSVKLAFEKDDPITYKPDDDEANQKHKTEFPWPMLQERKWCKGEVTIEPKESDDLLADFVLPASTQIVDIYSFVENPTRSGCIPPVGWHKSELWSFNNESEIEKMNDNQKEEFVEKQQAKKENPHKQNPEPLSQQTQNIAPKKVKIPDTDKKEK